MKLSKVFSVIAIAIMLVAMVSNVALAIDPGTISGNVSGSGLDKVQDLGEDIIGLIQVVGSVAAVAVLVVLGVKYMMGSTEEKAEYKKTLMPYVIGAVLIFAASNVASLLYKFAQGI